MRQVIAIVLAVGSGYGIAAATAGWPTGRASAVVLVGGCLIYVATLLFSFWVVPPKRPWWR